MNNELLLKYMQAHIRLHTQADISAWTIQQVIETFATLPMPAIPPNEWAVRCGFSEAEPEDPEVLERKRIAKARELGSKVMGFVSYHKSHFPKAKAKAEQEAACQTSQET